MMKALTLPPSLRKHSAQISQRAQQGLAAYRRLAPRERRLVNLLAAVGGSALVFLLAIEPAWKSLHTLQAELPQLRVQAATVADLASRARGLRRGASGGPAALPTDGEIDASLRQAGLSPELWRIEKRDEQRLTLRFEAASSATVLGWLDTAPRDWRLVLAEATLTRPRDADDRRLPGRLGGTVVLSTQAPQAQSGALR